MAQKTGSLDWGEIIVPNDLCNLSKIILPPNPLGCNVYKVILSPCARRTCFTFQPLDGPVVHFFLTLHFSTLNTHQTMEISIHPVPSKEFDSDLEDNSDQDIAVVGVQMATLSTTPSDNIVLETEPEGMWLATLSMTPPHDIVLFETELESSYEVTLVRSGLAAGPISMMALPDDNIVVSKTKPESDKEDTVVSLIHLITLELSLISNRQSSWKWDRGLQSNISSGSTISSCVISLDVVYSCSSFTAHQINISFFNAFPKSPCDPGHNSLK